MTSNSLLRALAHRNYRLFFAGQSISLIGTWMQQLAMAWLVYLKTGSPFWLGVIGFSGQIPSFFLSPVAGVLVDRWNRHRLLLLTQSLAMLQAFALAALDLAGVIQVWHVLVLSLFLGLVNAFDMTTRQAFLTEMVEDRADLANAIALNSSMVNATRLVGPALAGFVLAESGPGRCFLLNGMSYLAVLAALLAMRVRPHRRARLAGNLLHELRDGFAYAFGFAPIRSILLLLALTSLVGMSYSVLLPVFARAVLHGGAKTLGFLSAGAGVGALAGALFLASRKSVLGLGKWIMLAPALLGLGLIAFSFAQELWQALPPLFVVGFAMMVQMASSNTILQTIVEESKRGRVMSFYTMAFLGMAPLGSLLAGSLADMIGTTATLKLGGLTCVVGSLVFATQLARLREMVRPIYVRMGILPEVASGLQAAAQLTAPPEER
jgi:MFS family permease